MIWRLKPAHLRLWIFLFDHWKNPHAFFSTARGGHEVARRPARTVPCTRSLRPARPRLFGPSPEPARRSSATSAAACHTALGPTPFPPAPAAGVLASAGRPPRRSRAALDCCAETPSRSGPQTARAVL